ncbi:MAG: hypothetical protein ACJA2S_001813 [Cyclobacteriaceae bacterium]|jgi:hypothetical protein
MNIDMRAMHRYLGFFLAGIMFVYALSGIVLIYRHTDFLKVDKMVEKKLEPDIKVDEIGKALKIKDFKVLKQEGVLIIFERGSYNVETGVANYSVKELPYMLKQLTKLHKASSDQPLYWLNIFFGASLMFFVLSAFWMFRPRTKVFRQGMVISLIGVILTLALLYL